MTEQNQSLSPSSQDKNKKDLILKEKIQSTLQKRLPNLNPEVEITPQTIKVILIDLGMETSEFLQKSIFDAAEIAESKAPKNREIEIYSRSKNNGIKLEFSLDKELERHIKIFREIDDYFNLVGVNSPSPWGEILRLQCGASSASKSVSIPRPLAAGFFILNKIFKLKTKKATATRKQIISIIETEKISEQIAKHGAKELNQKKICIEYLIVRAESFQRYITIITIFVIGFLSFLNTSTTKNRNAELENHIVELENLLNKSKNNSKIKFNPRNQNIDYNNQKKYPSIVYFAHIQFLVTCAFLVLEFWLWYHMFIAKKTA
jgi:hypothetical protein